MSHCGRALLATTLFLWQVASAAAWDTSYWVWNRSQPLTETERTALRAQKVRTLFWQAGELENSGATWRWRSRLAVPAADPDFRFVPVLRLVSAERDPFSAPSTNALLAAIGPLAQTSSELQIDFDCPDRLIPDYARALRQIHSLVPRLSITALPSWSRAACLRTLEPCVDELLPMLYDFQPDPPIDGDTHRPLPLLAPEKLQGQLAAWNDCKIAWRAGLPTFARVTIFSADGKSRGHLRVWNWDDLSFNPALRPLGDTALGLTLFRAAGNARLGNTAVKDGDYIATRVPDRIALGQAVAAAEKTTARGVTFFRLPDGTDPSGFSLPQLGDLQAHVPNFVLRKSGAHGLALANESAADLEPRLAGYSLEIEAPAAIFREALPGDFPSVAAEAGSARVSVVLGTRLRFSFSHLRAGEALRTGLIQLAPGTDFRQLRYRIDRGEWKRIEE